MKSVGAVEEKQPNLVDRNLITPPTIKFTERAIQEIELILENDFTLKGLYFRILISGKGCDGFTYSTGFTEYNNDDFMIKIPNEKGIDFCILVDPFAAFYLQESTIDYKQDFENDIEGFVVINHLQKSYSGKFWRENPSIVPPLVKNI